VTNYFVEIGNHLHLLIVFIVCFSLFSKARTFRQKITFFTLQGGDVTWQWASPNVDKQQWVTISNNEGALPFWFKNWSKSFMAGFLPIINNLAARLSSMWSVLLKHGESIVSPTLLCKQLSSIYHQTDPNLDSARLLTSLWTFKLYLVTMRNWARWQWMQFHYTVQLLAMNAVV